VGLRLAGALALYWIGTLQHIQEGRAWLETLLARSAPDDHAAPRGWAEYGAGLLAWTQGDLAAAERWAVAAVDTATTRGDASQLASANVLRGMVRLSQGNPQAARPFLEQSRASFHAAGQRWEEAWVLTFLAGAAARGGDAGAAQRLAAESLAFFTRDGDTVGRAQALSVLGVVATVQGDFATAVARFAEGLPLIRASAGPYFLALNLVDAGRAWLGQGDVAQAQRLLAESLRLWRDLGRPDGVALAMSGLAEVAAVRGQPRRSARLLGAVETLRATAPAASRLLAPTERAVTAARDVMGAEAFAEAQAEGAALSPEQAIAEALEESTPGVEGTGAHD
jgi:non-specific serine/threonine protein kinase